MRRERGQGLELTESVGSLAALSAAIEARDPSAQGAFVARERVRAGDGPADRARERADLHPAPRRAASRCRQARRPVGGAFKRGPLTEEEVGQMRRHPGRWRPHARDARRSGDDPPARPAPPGALERRRLIRPAAAATEIPLEARVPLSWDLVRRDSLDAAVPRSLEGPTRRWDELGGAPARSSIPSSSGIPRHRGVGRGWARHARLAGGAGQLGHQGHPWSRTCARDSADA